MVAIDKLGTLHEVEQDGPDSLDTSSTVTGNSFSTSDLRGEAMDDSARSMPQDGSSDEGEYAFSSCRHESFCADGEDPGSDDEEYHDVSEDLGIDEDAETLDGTESALSSDIGTDAARWGEGSEVDWMEFPEGRVRTAVAAFVDRRAYFAKQRSEAAREAVTRRREHLQHSVAERREHAQAVIQRNLVRLRERRERRAARVAADLGEHGAEGEGRPERERARPLHKLTAKAGQMRHAATEKAVAELAERREAAKTVISRNLVRVRERRAARRARGLDAGRGWGDGGRRKDRRRSRSPHEPKRTHSPQPPTSLHSKLFFSAKEKELSVFTEEELDMTLRIRENWSQPPLDRPDAALVGDPSSGIRCWRWRGEGGIDEYETEYEVPVRTETFVAMQAEVDSRTQWDATTKHVETLHAAGPNLLRSVHKQAGDDQYILWLTASPFPLKDREFLLHRRLGTQPMPDDAGAAASFLRMDASADTLTAQALRPHIPKGAIRVVRLG